MRGKKRYRWIVEWRGKNRWRAVSGLSLSEDYAKGLMRQFSKLFPTDRYRVRRVAV